MVGINLLAWKAEWVRAGSNLLLLERGGDKPGWVIRSVMMGATTEWANVTISHDWLRGWKIEIITGNETDPFFSTKFPVQVIISPY